MNEADPDLIFLTPVAPRIQGHGASMRAGLNLEALATKYNVHLVIVLESRGGQRSLEDSIKNICASVTFVSAPAFYSLAPNSNFSIIKEYLKPAARLTRQYPATLAKTIYEKLSLKVPPSAIHCFRLALTEISYALCKLYNLPKKSLFLDLDDFESKTARRNADLDKKELGRLRYYLELREAARIRSAEKKASINCGGVFLCSETDRLFFKNEFPQSSAYVVPNGYRLTAPLPKSENSIPTLAFVGTLSYAPNTDGLNYFIKEIWPELISRRKGHVRLIVAGRTPPESVTELCQDQTIKLIPNPVDIREAYSQADALIVPLRTGGGTRIKILESLNFGRPVVSTSLGAEGLDLTHGKHLLIADGVEDFVAACDSLLSDVKQAGKLVEEGRRHFSKNYSPLAIRSKILCSYEQHQTGARE